MNTTEHVHKWESWDPENPDEEWMACECGGVIRYRRKTEPDPSWTERDGYVVAPLVNRGTLDAAGE